MLYYSFQNDAQRVASQSREENCKAEAAELRYGEGRKKKRISWPAGSFSHHLSFLFVLSLKETNISLMQSGKVLSLLCVCVC